MAREISTRRGIEITTPGPQQVQRISTRPTMTRAEGDDAFVALWLADMADATRRNFERTARDFLAALQPEPLRTASIEDVRDALDKISAGRADSTAKQYALRVKSLISFGHTTGYLQVNVGAAIKVKVKRRSVAKRLPSETEIALLIRAAPTKRDRVMLQVAYAGGLRVSELVAMTWGNVIERDAGRVQLHIVGKGEVEREVLLPAVVSRALVGMKPEGAGADEPCFRSRKGGNALTERAVNHMIKAAAAKADVNEAISAHWLRHGHASHALERGATLADVQTTLGHANVATTSTYLHSRPDRSSGLNLDDGVFLR